MFVDIFMIKIISKSSLLLRSEYFSKEIFDIALTRLLMMRLFQNFHFYFQPASVSQDLVLWFYFFLLEN